MTIDALANTFILSRQANGRAPRTIADYHRTLIPFVRWCARREITHLDCNIIRHYVARLHDNGWSLGTIGIYVRNLRALLNWLHQEGITGENLAQAVKAPKPTIRLENLPTSSEILSLLATCQDDRQALRDRALILTLLDTGLRTGELIRMCCADLHLEDDICWFHIHASKTNTSHFAFLGRIATCAMLSYLQTRSDSWPGVWVGLRGQLTATGIYKAIHRRALLAGLDPSRVHPHAFRKLFATLWTENGGDHFRLKRLGGWQTDEMLDRYILLAERSQLAAGHRRYGPVDQLLK